MKLFLLSHDLTPKAAKRFQKLIGAPKAKKALFISTAAVPYGKDPEPEWLQLSRDKIWEFSEQFDETNLEEETWKPERLDDYDFVYVCGGNSFYLAYRLAETGVAEQLKAYIQNGGVYAGSSAGAIILMDSIESFAIADHPEEAPRIYPGLNVIDFALIPHIDNEKYAPIMKRIAAGYERSDAQIIQLKDDQVLVVDGDVSEIT